MSCVNNSPSANAAAHSKAALGVSTWAKGSSALLAAGRLQPEAFVLPLPHNLAT